MDVVEFLRINPLFAYFPSSLLGELALVFEIVSIAGGDVLVKEADKADCLYLVFQGRLKAHQKILDDQENYLGEIGIGEVVGEVGLFTEKMRTATIRAVRDSTLLKLSQENFRRFIVKYPDTLFAFAQKCIQRLVEKPTVKHINNTLRTLVLAPAGGSRISKEFVSRFVKALSSRGSIIHLSSASKVPSVNWLNEQEKQVRYLIYETDDRLTPWTELCFRQADRVLFIGSEKSSLGLNEIEEFFFANNNKALVGEFIWLRESEGLSPGQMPLWLNIRSHLSPHHVNLFCDKDFQRLIRFILGEALGVVLSGGGARGLAHVGVLRALEELKIPIDYIAGTSMGSIIAASVACGMDSHQIRGIVENYIVPAARAWDYTLPLLSLKSGKRVTLALQSCFGKDRYIEECLIKFFCVSTNLSRSDMEIHLRGLLWESIRASIALPSVYPPFVDKKGDLLIDGAVVNNLPVDVMRGLINGGKIMSVSFRGSHSSYAPLPSWVSGWNLLKKRLQKQDLNIPSLGEVVVSSMMLESNEHQMRMKNEADYSLQISCGDFGMMDFRRFDSIIQTGYLCAMEKQEELSRFYTG